ncbi:hypothetical protein [Leptospira idonii]|uniref:Uncharacterized protein n=1 Tax=Leptospira idonii TaxID=1193500 RepID=A0A4R9M4Q9_9LEPT|nr:hypothetical protein [Leptospira idonii]TGN20951.1 hypothetical protein EHS15_00055 [Leptospira idonii]
MLHVLTTAEDFLKAFKLQKHCNVCIPLVEELILDYFADIARLKDFHDIENVNSLKVAAYLTHWTLKRRPIQILKYPKKHEYLEMIKEVNEWFAVALLTNSYFNRKILWTQRS